MKERGFWNRYGLMLLGILLYGIDLALIIFVTQQLYKNIVEVTTFAALPPTFFVLWLLRGKAGKENYRQDWLKTGAFSWIMTIILFIAGLSVWLAMPYSLAWSYALMMALGYFLYHSCLRKRIPGWGQRISELFVCIFTLELAAVLLFPIITGMKTVNQAEAILAQQGYEEIHYAVNTSPSGLERIFEDDAPELTRSEKKTGFYVFSAVDQGKEIGVVVSPASGRIVRQASLSNNLVLDLMIHR
jgi:hypothetical protein